jgi:hypothetical protein
MRNDFFLFSFISWERDFFLVCLPLWGNKLSLPRIGDRDHCHLCPVRPNGSHSSPCSPRRPPRCLSPSLITRPNETNKAGAGVAGQFRPRDPFVSPLGAAPLACADPPRDATDLERRHVEGAAPGP